MKTLMLLFLVFCIAAIVPAWSEPIQTTVTTNTGDVEYKLPGKLEFEKLAWKQEVLNFRLEPK